MVLNNESSSDVKELADDILAINTICRRQRKEKEEQGDREDRTSIQEETQTRAGENATTSNVPEHDAETLVEEVDGCF